MILLLIYFSSLIPSVNIWQLDMLMSRFLIRKRLMGFYQKNREIEGESPQGDVTKRPYCYHNTNLQLNGYFDDQSYQLYGHAILLAHCHPPTFHSRSSSTPSEIRLSPIAVVIWLCQIVLWQ
jgi:hypothetical protein